MIHLLKRNRVYRSYFGGKNLDLFFGIENPSISQFPEEWIASLIKAKNPNRENIEEGYSYCLNGCSLREIVENSPREILGNDNFSKYGSSMPFLLKLLDSSERLFIQCHPTRDFAKKEFDSQFGKTECWYIISAEKDAYVYLGFKEGASKEKLKLYFENQDIDGMLSMMHKLSVKSGDVVFVEGGVPHAIGSGCFLAEIQEPTDLMVIPERQSSSGITLTDEKMHGGIGFEKMFDVFDYTNYSLDDLKNKYVKHIDVKQNELNTVVGEDWTDKFKLYRIDLEGKFNFLSKGNCCVGIVLEGQCKYIDDSGEATLKKADEFFIPANTKCFDLEGFATVLLCQ